MNPSSYESKLITNENKLITFVDSDNVDKLKNLKAGTIFRYTDEENVQRVLTISKEEAGFPYASLLRCIELFTGLLVHLSPETLVEVPRDVKIKLTF